MKEMDRSFIQLAEKETGRIVAWRREIHRYPELAFEEFQTAALVQKALEEAGLELQKGIAKTGVVGLLRGSRTGPVIAVRADMDALPINEQTGLSFASVRPGLMHACGHDAHVAMALGAARVLAGLRETLPGVVKFIFQPCEESSPSGALAMLHEGVLQDPEVNAVLAIHVSPDFPSGTVGFKEGVSMAAVDRFQIAIRGQSGHSSTPQKSVDAILVAAEAVQSLQTIVSRLTDPLEPVVVSIGTINGGIRDNIVPDEVILTGSTRTLSPKTRRRIPELMRRLLGGLAQSYQAECELDYQSGFPPLVNDPGVLALAVRSCRDLIGPGRTVPMEKPLLSSEDFAYFAQSVPSAYLYLGVTREGEPVYPWHHPCFNLDESALPVGAALLARVCWDYLHGPPV